MASFPAGPSTKARTALVLSGGGMFGAWQAGAWQVLGPHVHPDLIVGASVGSLNGYAIAGGATVDDLAEMWMRPEIGQFGRLPETIRALMERYPLRTDFAVVLTDLLRMKTRTFRNDQITWRHLAASCAIPGFLPLQRIEGRWYGDGGLINPLPSAAAIELGATRIIALHVLAEIPPSIWKPLVKGLRAIAGPHPPIPPEVDFVLLKPDGSLGTAMEAIRWNRDNVERWLEQGREDAAKALAQRGGNISIANCLER